MMMEMMKTVGQTLSLINNGRRMMMTWRREMNTAVMKTKTVSTWSKTVMVVIPMNHSQVQKRVVLMRKMKTKRTMKKMMRITVSKKVNMTAKRKMYISMTVSLVLVQTLTIWMKIMNMKKQKVIMRK